MQHVDLLPQVKIRRFELRSKIQNVSPVVLESCLLHLLDPLVLLPLGARCGRAPPSHLRQPPLRVRKVLRAALVRHDRLHAEEAREYIFMSFL